jgi:hypothetical protein
LKQYLQDFDNCSPGSLYLFIFCQGFALQTLEDSAGKNDEESSGEKYIIANTKPENYHISFFCQL